MDFVIIANDWAAGEKNPTSKHRIAMELARIGHRVLWIEGSGMRTPSIGSGADRGRIVAKVRRAIRGAVKASGYGSDGVTECGSEDAEGVANDQRSTDAGLPSADLCDLRASVRSILPSPPKPGFSRRGTEITESAFGPLTSDFRPRTSDLGGIWVLSPLFIPLPRHSWVRRINGWVCRKSAERWARRLGFSDPVLINYVPVLAGAMRGWRGAEGRGQRSEGRGQRAEGRGQRAESRGQRAESRGQRAEVRPPPSDIGPRISDLGPRLLDLGSPTSDLRHRTSDLRPHPSRVVYHCVDRWDAFAMYDREAMASADEECCRRADVVIASSRDLEERCRRFNRNVHLVTHGVDHRHFARALAGLPRPSDLPPGPVVGFFGLISEWVDQELLIALAQSVGGEGQRTEEVRYEGHEEHEGDESELGTQEIRLATEGPVRTVDGSRRPVVSGLSSVVRRPVSVVLIGAADVDVSRLKGIPNLHLLGPRPFAELPAYVAHFTVGIIPFHVNELTRAVNPIKLREMLSAGCPVVSTALPEVTRHAAVDDGRAEYRGVGVSGCRSEEDCGERDSSTAKHTRDAGAEMEGGSPIAVRIADNREEFVAHVRATLRDPPDMGERRAISAGMAGETWTAKVQEILESVGVRE